MITLTVTNTADRPSPVIYGCANPDADILSIAHSGLPGPATILRRFRRWFAIVPDLGFAPGATAQITVDGRNLASVKCVPHSRLDPKFPEDPTEYLATRGPEQPDLQVDLRIEESSCNAAPHSDIYRAAVYFRELDVATHPSLLIQRNGLADARTRAALPELSYRADAILLFIPTLLGRLKCRFRGLPVTARCDPRHLAYLSGLQLEILGAAFPELANSNTRRALEAHALFGSGELVLETDPPTSALASRLTNGGPNGPLVFAWPEFALAAIEADVHATMWRSLLPGLLAAGHLYFLAYGEFCGGQIVKRPQSDYGSHPLQRVPVIERMNTLRKWTQRRPDDAPELLACLLRRGFSNLDGFGPPSVHTPDGARPFNSLAPLPDAPPDTLMPDLGP